MIRQVNNVLCYFQRLPPSTKYKLFCAYCTSFFGCELWSLTSEKVDSFCSTWRKSIRRIWNLPPQTHCKFLPLICDCFPIMDELCRRHINFVKSCVGHQCPLIRSLSLHAIFNSRGFSPIGQNIAFCMARYNCSIFDLLNMYTERIVSESCGRLVDPELRRVSAFISELLSLREGILTLPSGDALSADDLQSIIDYLCTN